MGVILGRKIGMTQGFGPDGELIPVTVIKAGPCKVVSTRKDDGDGYSAAVVGFEEVEGAKLGSKSLLGFFKKMNTACFRVLREFRGFTAQAGDDLTVAQFAPGESVIITGTSKGKGMTSVIKKWNFSRGRMSHGGNCKRKVGSIGMHTWPAHVIKGKKMAGRWGNEQVTLRTVEVVKAIPEDNLLLLKGPVPGSPDSLVVIRTNESLGKKKTAA
jgi:large subunit ribosomal protein L3